MTRAERVNYLASAAGLLAQSGSILALPNSPAALAWTHKSLTSLLWVDDGDARVDVFFEGKKVMATRWHPGGKQHEAISFKRGPWEQALADAAAAWVAGAELAGGASVH